MAILTMEQVMRELSGRDERGERTLLTETDTALIRRRMPDYGFRMAKKHGGQVICSGCGGTVDGRYRRHGDFTECPNCRKIVHIYDEWRGHRTLYEHRMIYLWKRSDADPEIILAKAIHAEKSFDAVIRPGAEIPLQAVTEAIYQFAPDGAKMYRRGYYAGEFSANAHSVTPQENKHGYGCAADHVGLEEAIEETRIGRTAIRMQRKHPSEWVEPVVILAQVARKRYIEYILNAGQDELARNIAQDLIRPKKRKAKRMPELLGLTEGQWYEVRKDGIRLDWITLNALYNLQRAGNMTVTVREAQIAKAQNSAGTRERLADRAGVLLAQCDPKIRRKAVRRAGLSPDLAEWIDYWDQLRRLGEDMTDARMLIPRDLHGMHQRMTERINALEEQRRQKENAELARQHEARMEKLRKQYTFEACGLILRPFETAAEVIAEGAAQHICIGGYADRYIKGQTILCALRRAEAPEEPWRAVEFSAQTGLMVQDRGKYNDRGLGAENMKNGVEGWLRRFWAAFDAHREAEKDRRARETR